MEAKYMLMLNYICKCSYTMTYSVEFKINKSTKYYKNCLGFG